MKPSAPLKRRTPLKRHTPLPKRRTPLARISPRARLRARRQRRITVAVFERDGHRCILWDIPGVGRCFGPLTPHHLVKRAAGGADTLDNEVTLCAGHNTWVEDNPTHATELGLVAHRRLQAVPNFPRVTPG